LLQYNSRAQRDDLAAKARAIIAWQFVSLTNADALPKIAAWFLLGGRLRVRLTCERHQTERRHKRCTHTRHTKTPGSLTFARKESELGPATIFMPHRAA
jgi:hypothetical protein